ncbi:MAG: PilZ domain-containing protein [Deltaproteobacteria bacterium]|nr:PilZ domain-containing protein [Deltaproteobacteria bacterium]MBW2137318.1 PilZ domain-containing protein [Deltaproteobacteria bacterium]
METKKDYNRRAQLRFLTNGETFAYIRNHFSVVGRIRDASLGGLAVEYASGQDKGIQGDVEVDILVGSDGFSLLKIPARIVWKKNVLELEFGATRRLGIAFDRLTRKQMSQLRDFLRHHTEAGQ